MLFKWWVCTPCKTLTVRNEEIRRSECSLSGHPTGTRKSLALPVQYQHMITTKEWCKGTAASRIWHKCVKLHIMTTSQYTWNTRNNCMFCFHDVPWDGHLNLKGINLHWSGQPRILHSSVYSSNWTLAGLQSSIEGSEPAVSDCWWWWQIRG